MVSLLGSIVGFAVVSRNQSLDESRIKMVPALTPDKAGTHSLFSRVSVATGIFIEWLWTAGCHALYVSRSRLRPLAGAVILGALVLLVYRPLLPGSFLMDDERLIKLDNPLVQGQFTPRSIWFQTDFPLSNVLLWLQYRAWGDHPAGYHAVNLALHALSAILLWRLLVRLKIPGAWLGALIFAVHPVCVNSVARIAEVKNTLSLPFFLLSFLGYLHYEALALYPPAEAPFSRGRAAGWYAVALLAFVLALFSKTTTVMLPVALLLCAAWQRGGLTRRDWLHTGPFFLLALAFGLLSVWFQKHGALAGQGLPPSSFAERLAGAGYNFWFYLGKALLPLQLSIVYVRWKPGLNSIWAFAPLVLAVLAGVVCWRYRRGRGRHAWFALGCFGVALFPALGFFDAQYLTKFQVSDHLQYLPLIAPVALAAALVATLPAYFRWTFSVALVVILSGFTFERSGVFSTPEKLMRDTLAKNPAASCAHNDLGVILAQRADYSRAAEHFAASVHADPDNLEARANLGQLLAMQRRFNEARDQFLSVLQRQPMNPEAHANFANVLVQLGREREALPHLRVALRLKPKVETRLNLAALLYRTGDYRQSAEQYQQALAIQPDLPEPLNNLAWLLATCPDDSVRDGTNAVRCAEHACRLTNFRHSASVGTLAAAYAEAGRFAEAVAAAETSLRLAEATGEREFASVNRQLLGLYRSGKPFHEPPALREP